ncbi:MAG: SsrA-binding protein SmpB [Candidatus Krumholzibacteria bacterium]|jgi:SsrA-binding protein|nr:SsrA-binding protein SmpB [Candidatus Krumholzibacteria bacterium]
MKIICTNRKARHDYEILETIEAGMVLRGTEVKSLRAGNAQLKDSYAAIEGNELFLLNAHISPYEMGNRFNHEPTRTRKLLVHAKEIKRLLGKTQEKGLTLVPLKLYFNDAGKVKVELGLARGKKSYDKRRAIADRDAKRELARAVKEKDRER